jgi:hypothetical protein
LGPTVCVTRFLTPPAYTATFGFVHYVVPWLDVLISLDKLTFPFVVLVHIHGFVHSTRRVHEVKLDTVYVGKLEVVVPWFQAKLLGYPHLVHRLGVNTRWLLGSDLRYKLVVLLSVKLASHSGFLLKGYIIT